MLVSIPEFRQALNGVNLTEGQVRAATDLLSGIQQELELWLNRPVEPVFVKEFATSDGSGFCRLSVSPVHSIYSVSRADSSARPSSSIIKMEPLEKPLDLDPEIRTQRSMGQGTQSFFIVPGGIQTTPGRRLYISYVGGLEHYASASIKKKILQIATRSWVNERHDAIGLRDGTPAQADVQTGLVGWTLDELYAFDRYRRRVVR